MTRSLRIYCPTSLRNPRQPLTCGRSQWSYEVTLRVIVQTTVDGTRTRTRITAAPPAARTSPVRTSTRTDRAEQIATSVASS
eukprot:scaffold36147_cov14-Prasinocladus_malaysianus.AAC.1